MIEVYAARRGSRCRLYVKGHADAAGQGVRVCAGVSALVGTLVGFAANASDARHLRTMLSAGQAFLSCRGGLGAAFDAAVWGLLQIAAENPAHLRVFAEGLTTNAPRRATLIPTAPAV